MRINRLSYFSIVSAALWMGAPLLAQDKPLSVIDWLDDHAAQAPLAVALPNPSIAEDPVSPTATVPIVQTTPLGTQAIRQIGLVPPDVTGLPASLWHRSEAAQLSRQLARMPDLQLPAGQALLYRLLLTETLGPDGDIEDEDTFTLARVEMLVRYGAVDPALALIEQAGIDRDKAHFQAFMDVTLLTGAEDTACAVLMAKPQLAPSHAARVFCSARTGDWNTAALLWDTGRALGMMAQNEIVLLDRFLNPDLYEDAPPLPTPQPADVTPLIFRIHEAIGEPLATRPLPRAFAVADLRDVAGWKAQLEAAERLTRSGALPENRLLGIYTARSPAASGGIWDRVAALQRFETALKTGSVEAVTKTLPPVWSAMQDAAIEVSFASLFAEDLARIQLKGTAATTAQQVRLLSSQKEVAAQTPSGPSSAVLNGIALGRVDGLKPRSDQEAAVLRAWQETTARPEMVRMAEDGRLGEALLRTLEMLNDGSNGDLNSLSTALGTLRSLGQENTARSAAIEFILLGRDQ